MSEPPHWRRVAATLADPDRRLLYARLVLAGPDEPMRLDDLDAADRRRLTALTGAGLVVLVLLILLRDLRAGLIVASVIPLSMLFALALMRLFGVCCVGMMTSTQCRIRHLPASSAPVCRNFAVSRSA